MLLPLDFCLENGKATGRVVTHSACWTETSTCKCQNTATHLVTIPADCNPEKTIYLLCQWVLLPYTGIYGNSSWLPGAFAPGFLGSKFCFSKLFKKFRKKSCTYQTIARTTLWNFAAKCHRMRPGKKWQISRSEIQIFGSHFMSEICHFCSGRIRWHFATTFYTVVRVMVRYVHDFFSQFFEKFSIYSNFSKKPGANAPGSQIAAPVIWKNKFDDWKSYQQLWNFTKHV
jgi:hypothetical protein